MAKSLPAGTVSKALQSCIRIWDTGVRTKSAFQRAIVSETGIAKATAWRLLMDGDASSADIQPIWEQLQDRQRSKELAKRSQRDSLMVKEFGEKTRTMLERFMGLMSKRAALLEEALTCEAPEYMEEAEKLAWRLNITKELKLAPKQMRDVGSLLSDLRDGKNLGTSSGGSHSTTEVNVSVNTDGGVIGVDAKAARAALITNKEGNRDLVVETIRQRLKGGMDEARKPVETTVIDLDETDYTIED